MQSIPVNCVYSGKKNAYLRIKIGLGELCLNGLKTVLQEDQSPFSFYSFCCNCDGGRDLAVVLQRVPKQC